MLQNVRACFFSHLGTLNGNFLGLLLPQPLNFTGPGPQGGLLCLIIDRLRNAVNVYFAIRRVGIGLDFSDSGYSSMSSIIQIRCFLDFSPVIKYFIFEKYF